MNLYEIELKAVVLVEADNAVFANKVAKRCVKVIGNCIGWEGDKSREGKPYRIEISDKKMSLPKKVKQ